MTMQSKATDLAVTPERRSPRRRVAERSADRLLPLLVPLAVLLLWLLNGHMDWLPPQILPSPASVIRAFKASLATAELLTNIGKTLLWLLVGYVIGAILGVLIGAGMGLSQRFEDYVAPSFKAVSYVPILAWLPLWLVLFGIGNTLKVVLIAQATFAPVVLNVHDGIRRVSPEFIELGRVFGLRRAQMVRRIMLPAAFPSIWSGIRFGLTKAWLALVAVELLASTEGLGFMMVNARALYQLDVMFVAVAAIGAIGFALDRGLEAAEHRVLAWRDERESHQ